MMMDNMAVEGVGSPARAGIDRAAFLEKLGDFGFPRTLGDRPEWDGAVYVSSRVPPHARG